MPMRRQPFIAMVRPLSALCLAVYQKNPAPILQKKPRLCGRGFFFKREIYFGAMPSTPMARKSEYFLPSLSHQGRTLSLKCLSLAALLGYWMMR
jgi:hypothetical protein